MNLETAIINKDWKDEIELYWARARTGWRTSYMQPLHQYLRRSKIGQEFLGKIWEMSKGAFDHDREVQVVIDANAKLFISVGNPGFVSFDGQEESLIGMQMPLKEWIHTHPFGSAYFSGTDLRTIAIWERYLESATVLGSDERMSIYFRVSPEGEHFQEFAQYMLVGDEEE